MSDIHLPLEDPSPAGSAPEEEDFFNFLYSGGKTPAAKVAKENAKEERRQKLQKQENMILTLSEEMEKRNTYRQGVVRALTSRNVRARNRMDARAITNG